LSSLFPSPKHLPHLPGNIGIEKQFHPVGLRQFNLKYPCATNIPACKIGKDRKHSLFIPHYVIVILHTFS